MNWKTGIGGPQSKKPGEPYAFWSCPQRDEYGNWCKGKPVTVLTQNHQIAPDAINAPPARPMPQPVPTTQNDTSDAVLIELRAIRAILERYEESYVNNKLGIPDDGIPIIE